MKEVDRVLYKLGYYGDDPQKKAEVEGYIAEAQEFMKSCGVLDEHLNSATAYTIKSIWAVKRDEGDENSILKKDGMVIALISQLKRRT